MSMDTAESMSTVDAVEAGTAAPFTSQGWLQRLCSKSSSDAGIGGHDVWVCSCGHDFGDGSTRDAALAREHERSKEHQRPLKVTERDWPLARTAARNSSGEWVCKCGKCFGVDPSKTTSTHVQQHEASTKHKDYITSTQTRKTLFGYFQPAASSTAEKTAKTSSAMEDSGEGS